MYLIELHALGKCDPETCAEPGHASTRCWAQCDQDCRDHCAGVSTGGKCNPETCTEPGHERNDTR